MRYKKDPRSPCFTCQFYRKMDYVDGRWVFKVPNPPNFATIEDEHAWCILGVLDRYPQVLEGARCRCWVSREVPLTLVV